MTTAEMTTEEFSPEVEEGTFDTVSMEEQERQLGETAKTTYLEAGVKKKEALNALRDWETFFAERGINPQVQINRMLAAKNAQSTAVPTEQQIAQMPPKSSDVVVNVPQQNKALEDFMANYVKNHTEGFTVVELINAAIAEKIIPDNTKESREPIFLTLNSFKKDKKIVESPNKRNNETVYLLA